MVIPDGSWVKCKNCGQTLYTDRLADNLLVCWYCNCHLSMDAHSRIVSLTDPDSFAEMDADLKSVDFLHFTDSKPYTARLEENEKKTRLNDAIVCGSAKLDGRPYMLGVMDFRFMGASMGSVVGEKITRLVEAATAAKLPVVIVTASGGARMQEGIMSLMQMAKTCAALERHAEARAALLRDPDQSDLRRRDREFCGGRRRDYRRTGSHDRLRRSPRDSGDHQFQTARRLPDRRIPVGKRTDRPVVERKNLRKELGLLLDFFKK